MSSCPYCSAPPPDNRKPGERAELLACRECLNPMVLAREGNTIMARPVDRTDDVRQLAPEGSIGGAMLQCLPRALKNLPVLPEVSTRVLRMVRDPEASMVDLAHVIRGDSVIALKLLQLANSPVYGGLQEISDLDAACARLGMRTISNAVQAVANANLFVTGVPHLRAYMKNLWRHSVAVAHCSAQLATQLAEPHGESLFVAGLLHDIGKVVMLDIISSQYGGVLKDLRDSPDLAREAIDSFHGLVGLHVVQALGLPPEFGVMVYCHHDPELAPDPAWLSALHIVSLSNAVAKVEGFTVAPHEEIYLVSHPSAHFLNLDDLRLASLRVDLADRLEVLIDVVSPD